MELIQWDNIRTQIETAKDIEELTSLKDKLRAYQILAEQSKQSAEVQTKIAIYKARADRKCGEWLKDNIKSGGQRGNQYKKVAKSDVTTLAEIGVTKNESSRLQKIADIPEEKFEGILQEAEEETKKVTNNMLVKIANESKKNENINNKRTEYEDRAKETPQSDRYVDIFKTEQKFRVVYADPAWSYNDKCEGGGVQDGGVAKRHYDTMSTNEICGLPVENIVDKDAVLFLWVTSPLLEDGLEVMSNWGFKYKSSFIWDKVKHNMGHYNSVRHEFLLIGVKGSCTPDNKKLFDSVQSIEKSNIHSQKPGEFIEIIDNLYNWGERIELFCRKNENKKWFIWGNEI